MNELSRLSRKLPIASLSLLLLGGAWALRPAFGAGAKTDSAGRKQAISEKAKAADPCAAIKDAKKKAACLKEHPVAKPQGRANSPSKGAFSSVPAVGPGRQVCKGSSSKCLPVGRTQPGKKPGVVKKDPTLQALLPKDVLAQLKRRPAAAPLKPAAQSAPVVLTKAAAPAKAPPPVNLTSAEPKKKSWWESLLDAGKGLASKIVDAGKAAVKAVVNGAKAAGSAVVAGAKKAAAAAGDALKKAPDFVSDKANDLLGGAYSIADAKVALLHKIGLTRTVGDPEGWKSLVHLQNGQTCAIVSTEEVLKSIGINKSEDQLMVDAYKKGYYGVSKSFACTSSAGQLDQGCTLSYNQKQDKIEVIDSGGGRGETSMDIHQFMHSSGDGMWPGPLLQDESGKDVVNKRFSSEMGENPVKSFLLKPFYTARQKEELKAQEQQKKPVIVTVDAGRLWGETSILGSLHAIVVTGVEVSPLTGRIVGYHINDSAWPHADQLVSKERFEHAWMDDDSQLVYVK